MVIQPTGKGKSLCYQLVALQQKKLVFVFVPTLALMSYYSSMHTTMQPHQELQEMQTCLQHSSVQHQVGNQHSTVLDDIQEVCGSSSLVSAVWISNYTMCAWTMFNCMWAWLGSLSDCSGRRIHKIDPYMVIGMPLYKG